MRTTTTAALIALVISAVPTQADIYRCRSNGGVDGKSGELVRLDSSAAHRYTPILINTYTGYIRLGRKGLFGERGAIWKIFQLGDRLDAQDWGFSRTIAIETSDPSRPVNKKLDVLRLRTGAINLGASKPSTFWLYKDGRFFSGTCEQLR